MQTDNRSEMTKINPDYIIDERNHDHVKDISLKLQQPNNVNRGRTKDDYSGNSNKHNKVLLPNLMKSATFEEHFFNVTNPNIRYKQWFNEGVLIAVSTDKPVYRPGDVVDIRAYYFNHTDKAPVKCTKFSPNLNIIDSNDEIKFSKYYDYKDKCGKDDPSYMFKYEVPKDAKGGVYYVKVYDYSAPEAVVKIRIRDYQQKSIVKLDYSQESYNPGDEVQGKLTYELVDDSDIPHDAYFSLTTSAANSATNFDINKNGFGFFSFKIPNDWTEDSIFVTFNIKVGAKQTTKSDTVTVVQKDNLVIDFTGESGKIVESVMNRFYFECFTDESRSEHADIFNGEIVESHMNSEQSSIVAASVSTLFNGRGYFEFIPKPSHDYSLRYKGVDHRINISQNNEDVGNEELDSEAKVLIKTDTPVVKNEDRLEIELVKPSSDKKLELMLAISQKSTILLSQPVELVKDSTKVTISMKQLKLVNGGVISISLYDQRAIRKREERNSNYFYYGEATGNFPYQIVAERLIFILPSESLQIKIETDRKVYSPGQEVKYDVIVTDKSTGKQVKDDVYVSLSVTDLSAFLQVENKKQPPSLVSKVYLEKEIKPTKEFEFLNANEFLNYLYQITENENENPEEAMVKIELLLGTQKWRLFKFDPVVKQKENHVLYDGGDKLSVSFISLLFYHNLSTS